MPEGVTPITTYEGATNYNDYLTWKKNNDQYNLYQKEGERLVSEGAYANPVSFTADKFKSMFGMQDFSLPEGATGFTRYEVSKEGVNPQVNGNFYSDPSGKYVYIPSYSKPTNEYQVVKSPDAIKQEEQNQAWTKYIQDNKITGFVREVYYDPQSNSNKTEYLPYKGDPEDYRGSGKWVEASNVPLSEVLHLLPGSTTTSPSLKKGGLLYVKGVQKKGNLIIK
jgi:hypothetical protein